MKHQKCKCKQLRKMEAIKDGLIRDIKTLFKQKDNYYKSVGVGKFWNDNYIKYESSGDRNQNLSVK